MGRWILGVVMGLLSLIGLAMMAHAVDGVFALYGGLVCLVGLIVIFVLVHQATGQDA